MFWPGLNPCFVTIGVSRIRINLCQGKMDICDFVFHRMISAQTSTIGTEIAVWAMVAMAVSMTIIFDNSLAERPCEELRSQVESSGITRRHLLY